MVSSLSRFLVDLRDVCFPGRCVVCRLAVDGGGRFCDVCDRRLVELEDRPQCLDCGSPLAMELSPCQRCGGKGFREFATVVRLGVFDEPLKPLVHRLKFFHGWGVGELLAGRAFELARVRKLLSETDVLVPVPLHAWRQIGRGFDQADVIARRLAALGRCRVRRPAARMKFTAAQSLQTSRAARVENARDAFALVAPRGLAGKRVTLVDDVMTTGATLKALAKTLAPAHPASLSVLTIAAADPKGHRFEAT